MGILVRVGAASASFLRSNLQTGVSKRRKVVEVEAVVAKVVTATLHYLQKHLENHSPSHDTVIIHHMEDLIILITNHQRYKKLTVQAVFQVKN